MSVPPKVQVLPSGSQNCEEIVRKALNIMVTELLNSTIPDRQREKEGKPYHLLVNAEEEARLLLVKIMVLLNWTENMEIVQKCNDLINKFRENIDILQKIKGGFDKIYNDVSDWQMPLFPMNSAVAVLNQHKYPYIPVLCDAKANVRSRVSQQDGKRLIQRILQTRILSEEIPSFVSSIRVEEKAILCEEKNLFLVSFTTTVLPNRFPHL